MQKVVGVKFSASNKVYTFNANGNNLNVGDHVIVDSALGLSYGTIVTGIKEFHENIIMSSNDNRFNNNKHQNV